MAKNQLGRGIAHGVTDGERCHAPRAPYAASEGRAQHARAVLVLRGAVTEAFLAQAGGDPVASPGGLVLAVSERSADAVNDGLLAARAVWAAAPYEVRIEVSELDLVQGDIRTSYDLSTVPSRTTVEDGESGLPHRASA